MGELTLSGLTIYPVKSLAGIALDHSRVEAFGLQHDRRWMVVDEQGLFVTQRSHPRMCLIRVVLQPWGILLGVAGQLPLSVPVPDGETVLPVQIWDDHCQGWDGGEPAARWLSHFLGFSCRLVYFPDQQIRTVDQHYARPGDKTAFSDGFPLLLISQASLDDLNSRLAQPVEMARFRPNLVVAGCTPFAEDGWRRMRIGQVTFRIVKPCSRCSIPNVDPLTGERGKEPAATLSRYRKRDNKIFFGQNVIADNSGELALGMPVEILD